LDGYFTIVTETARSLLLSSFTSTKLSSPVKPEIGLNATLSFRSTSPHQNFAMGWRLRYRVATECFPDAACAITAWA